MGPFAACVSLLDFSRFRFGCAAASDIDCKITFAVLVLL